jgi:hypothetical protein
MPTRVSELLLTVRLRAAADARGDRSGRCLTLLIEATDEPTTWLVIGGSESSRERKIIEGQP